MVSLAQQRRVTREFELHGSFYAVDFIITNLLMTVFRWAHFCSTKSGIRVHTQIDIAIEIPVFYRITNAKEHDTKAMGGLIYEPKSYHVFDRGYFVFARLFSRHTLGTFFIIRKKGHHDFEIVGGDVSFIVEANARVDKTIRFIGKRNKGNYPSDLRSIVYYVPELGRSFIYYTNNFYLPAKDIALLHRYRWHPELLFKGIKQYLCVKTFWGESENAVWIQIYVAIISYCLIAIIEHGIKLGGPVFEVMRILGSSLLVKTTS